MLSELLIVLEDHFQHLGIVLKALNSYTSAIAVTEEVTA